MKKLAFISFLILCGPFVTGQQLPLFSQYLYNKYLINPAVAGSDGYTSFNLTAREQWIGYSGAPRTFSFSGQTRILKQGYSLKQSLFKNKIYRPSTDGRVGLGGYVFSDRNGLIQRTGFQASYSYHMWLESNTQLSMGIAFTGYHFKINENELNFEDPNEPWMNNELRRGIFVPDASFGIYLLNVKYSFGFSTEQLFGAASKIGDDAYRNFSMDRHYYAFGTYSITSGRYIEIRPSVLVMMSEQLKPLADIGITYSYDQSLWAGLSYRTSRALIANFGVRYTNLFIGYAFDFTLSQIQRVTYGTHEITVAFKFGDSARKYRWLDRY
ncbi:MAG TPA: type IX secretion system membrane protein PorP/SprF [Bacteroidales bacterium]|nr:type IX secretion system membrane protein PorP/SprF [Bacteroidales bacterium]HUV01520.1 type IX secretion system membrane protein PorP/SprF [Bacteroidales bacterium]